MFPAAFISGLFNFTLHFHFWFSVHDNSIDILIQSADMYTFS